jgi:hypothetical protein
VRDTLQVRATEAETGIEGVRLAHERQAISTSLRTYNARVSLAASLQVVALVARGHLLFCILAVSAHVTFSLLDLHLPPAAGAEAPVTRASITKFPLSRWRDCTVLTGGDVLSWIEAESMRASAQMLKV